MPGAALGKSLSLAGVWMRPGLWDKGNRLVSLLQPMVSYAGLLAKTT